MPKKIKKKEQERDWQDLEPVTADKDLFKQAVAEYAYERDKDADDVDYSLRTILKIIPSLASLDKRWSAVDKTNFNTHHHRAHKVFYHTARNLIKNKNKFQEEIDKLRDKYASDSSDDDELEIDDNPDDELSSPALTESENLDGDVTEHKSAKIKKPKSKHAKDSSKTQILGKRKKPDRDTTTNEDKVTDDYAAICKRTSDLWTKM